jgi:hypothetical protein
VGAASAVKGHQGAGGQRGGSGQPFGDCEDREYEAGTCQSSTEEWENIPDCVELSIKKRKRDKYIPVLGSLMVNLLPNASRKNKTHKTSLMSKRCF